MKKLIWPILILLALSAVSFAQHCPFDGAHIIVVHLTDADKMPVMNAPITLQEVDNPEAESCSYSKGLLSKTFMPVKDLLNTGLYFRSKQDIAEKYCADCSFLGDGYYAASLSQAEESCMIAEANNGFRYRKRKFGIFWRDQVFTVDPSSIHTLCLGAGKWSRIAPIELSQKL